MLALTRMEGQEEIAQLEQRLQNAEEHGNVMQGGLSQSERTLMVEQMSKLEQELERAAEQKSDLEDSLDSSSAELKLMEQRVQTAQREASAAHSRLQQVQGQLQQAEGDAQGSRSREEDLSLIRELQMQLEQVEADKEQKGALLASMQDRVATAELARNRLHDLVLDLETDARRLTAEKLKLSHQVATLSGQASAASLPSPPSLSSPSEAAHPVRAGETAVASDTVAVPTPAPVSVFPHPAASSVLLPESDARGNQAAQKAAPFSRATAAPHAPPTLADRHAGIGEGGGAGFADWQGRNGVEAVDVSAGATDVARGSDMTLEHFLSRPLQDFAPPELPLQVCHGFIAASSQHHLSISLSLCLSLYISTVPSKYYHS